VAGGGGIAGGIIFTGILTLLLNPSVVLAVVPVVEKYITIKMKSNAKKANILPS
jgi:hypothetical protein